MIGKIILSISNITRKRTQSIFIFLIMLVCSLSFSVSYAILAGTSSPYEKMNNKLNGSHLTIVFNSDVHNPDDIYLWWKKKKGIKSISSIISTVIINSPELNGKELDSDIFLCEIPESIVYHDKLQYVYGSKKKAPKNDELWIPTSFAYKNGIKIGDKIGISTENGKREFKVSAIVVDPVYSAPMLNPVRVWINKGIMKSLYSKKNVKLYLLGIRFNNRIDEPSIWKDFEDHLKKPFSGFKYTYELVSNAFLFSYQLVGVFMLVFAVLLIFITIYIIYSVVNDSIISDFRSIGILKANGFTPFDIVFVYVLQLLLISSISIFSGILLSSFVINKISENFLNSLGIKELSMPFIYIFLSVYAILMSIVTITSIIVSVKAGKVKAADSIRSGAPENAKKGTAVNLMEMKRTPFYFMMVLYQIKSSKGQSIFSFITFMLTAFVMVFSVIAYQSAIELSDNRSYFGFDRSDLMIISKGKKTGVDNREIEKILKSDTRIKAFLKDELIISGVISRTDNMASLSILGTVYDGDMNKMGLINMEGKNPASMDEIAISFSTAKKYNKKVNDRLKLNIEGKEFDLKVCGIYQYVDNMGYGYRVKIDTLREKIPYIETNTFLVKLKKYVNISKFRSDMNNKLQQKVNIKSTESLFKNLTNVLTESIRNSVAFIAVIFNCMLLIIVISSIMLSVQRNKKLFGIYKTLGITSNEIRKTIVIKTIIIAVISTISGTSLCIIIMPYIMNALTSGIGIAEVPFKIDILKLIFVILLMFLVSIISPFFASKRVLHISAKELSSE